MNLSPAELVLIPAVIAGILLLMWSVRRIALRLGLPAETQRKLVHVATGGAALSFPLIFESALPVVLLAASAIAVMLLLRTPVLAGSGLNAVLHEVQRKSYGEVYLALAIAVLFFRAQGQPVLYVLPLLVITLSDTASALIGTSYGRTRFAVEDGSKSLEGVAAFFVVTWLVTMMTLLLITEAGRTNVILLSFLIAAFCALVEADSWRGLDNLFVPIGAHLFLARHLDWGALDLILMTIGFAAAIAAMLATAPLLKISGHAARAYTVLLFLVFSVTAPHNALLPIAAILMHMVARSRRPGRSRHPDLELLLAAAAVSLLWLLAGEAFGRTAIDLFNLTFAAVAVVFAGLAVAGACRPALVAVAILAGGLYLFVGTLNPPEARWYETAWPVLLAGLGSPAAVALLVPNWFADQRSLKAFALALIVPAGLFITEGAIT